MRLHRCKRLGLCLLLHRGLLTTLLDDLVLLPWHAVLVAHRLHDLLLHVGQVEGGLERGVEEAGEGVLLALALAASSITLDL